jgi:methionyl-tRNA synthetase
MNKQKKFISTAIDYVNGLPHIGHALEKIQADVIARYHRILGEEVLFLSGTDENALKNVRAAEEQKIPVKKLVDKNAKKFLELQKILNLSFDNFIRTTEERHIKGSQKLWLACKKDIYKKAYTGLYCVGCEEFYKENELEKGFCSEHKKKTELIKEENYFFKLSKYQNQIKKLIESNKVKIIPKTRKNEVLSFINSGLQDICISRSNERARGWGIDVPEDNTQKIWVWFDALANYITALGYGDNDKKFQEWWQENKNKLHVIGKGISRFHCIYWLGILLSAKLALPKTIFIHGYITVNGQKMSKSIGNVIDPFELVEKYGIDPVRYFLLREIPSTEDGDFTYQKFEERYNADLANGLGNLVARVLTLAKMSDVKIPGREVDSPKGCMSNQCQNPNVKNEIHKAQKENKAALEEFKFNDALTEIWRLIKFCDQYVEETKLWEDTKNKKEIISDLLIALQNIAQLLEPFLPETGDKILKQLKLGRQPKPLFPRL